jgi:hypothetical protein
VCVHTSETSVCAVFFLSSEEKVLALLN